MVMANSLMVMAHLVSTFTMTNQDFSFTVAAFTLNLIIRFAIRVVTQNKKVSCNHVNLELIDQLIVQFRPQRGGLTLF